MDMTDERIIASPGADWGNGGLGRMLVKGLLSMGLIAIGAAGAVLMLRFGNHMSSDPVTATPTLAAVEAPAVASPADAAPADEVEVVLSPEAVAQTGIKTEKVTVAESNTSIQVP